MKGRLWVIEGCDGAGKATQAKMLIDRINKSGMLGSDDVHLWTFPKYKVRPFGPLVRLYLDGKFGEADKVNPYFSSMLYSLDRWQEADRMQSLLDNGDWIICDRYASSNMGFQSIRIPNEKERDEFVEWIDELEFNRFKIPRPDGTIFLSLPPEVSMARTDARRANAKDGDLKSAKKDIHEQNKDIMTKAYNQYHHLAKKYGWIVIDCYENNHELTREEIAEKVWDIITTK